MNPAWLTLIALVAALAMSMTSRVNVGWLALTFAWLIGVYAAGLRADVVLAGFPVTLFLTLTGVALLFAIAETNGALAWLVRAVLPASSARARWIGPLLFAVACLVSSVGPGAISTVALLAPIAMAAGARAGVSPLVVALMVTNGANAGNLSPFSTVGIIANSAMAKAGLTGHAARVWFANFAAHVIVAFAAYLWLLRSERDPTAAAAEDNNDDAPPTAAVDAAVPATAMQRFTIFVVAAWIVAVVGFNAHLGLAAFAAATLLLLARAADEAAAVRRVPWAVVMMVCGVTVLIALLEKTGGMDLFTALLARAATPRTIDGVIALVTGAISTYSSTSGVVLPTFLPAIPALVQRVGGGDPLAVALSINVGSSLVDVSPLSTLGALCVAAVPAPASARPLFRALLAWGLSMIVVGAVLCQLLAGWLARG